MTTINWRNPTCRLDAETALDSGKLYAQRSVGKFWLARRNGATKTWKTDPNRFRIPIKYGFKEYATIEQDAPWHMLRIANSREEAEQPTADKLPNPFA